MSYRRSPVVSAARRSVIDLGQPARSSCAPHSARLSTRGGDGAEATRIAERSTLFAWRPRPDTLVSLLDIDARRRGDLVLIDPVTRAERRVDQRVFARPLATRSETDILRYGVQDGERSGVWQVRLPAP